MIYPFLTIRRSRSWRKPTHRPSTATPPAPTNLTSVLSTTLLWPGGQCTYKPTSFVPPASSFPTRPDGRSTLADGHLIQRRAFGEGVKLHETRQAYNSAVLTVSTPRMAWKEPTAQTTGKRTSAQYTCRFAEISSFPSFWLTNIIGSVNAGIPRPCSSLTGAFWLLVAKLEATARRNLPLKFCRSPWAAPPSSIWTGWRERTRTTFSLYSLSVWTKRITDIHSLKPALSCLSSLAKGFSSVCPSRVY